MTNDEKNQVIAEALVYAEDHLYHDEDHSYMVDRALTMGLAMALETRRNAPVHIKPGCNDPEVMDLLDRISMHYHGSGHYYLPEVKKNATP